MPQTLTTEVIARQKIERRIVRELLKQLIANSYYVAVDNGETFQQTDKQTPTGIMALMFQTDDEWLKCRDKVSGKVSTVMLIYGNSGWDVVADYSMSLEHVMEPVHKLSDKLSK